MNVMILFSDFFNMIELKINAGDLLTAFIALLALWYTIYSTKENQRKSVLPFFVIEPIGTAVKVIGNGRSATIEDNITDYRALLTKESKIISVDSWRESERKIILNEREIGKNAWAYGQRNYPTSMKLINVGKNVAVSFKVLLDDKTSYPKKIDINKEVVVSILLENEDGSGSFFIRFRDIYGNEYKQKIEFNEGRLYLNSSLKKVYWSRMRTQFQKIKSKIKLKKNKVGEKNNIEK